MKKERYDEISRQIYALARDLAADEAEDWTDVLAIHTTLIYSLGFACGRAYGQCPAAEAKYNAVNLAIVFTDAAQCAYDDAQVEVANWRLNEIVKGAGKAVQS
jgi:hypothetical protein